jgi:tetratricopeptide (TPR) repeat protein
MGEAQLLVRLGEAESMLDDYRAAIALYDRALELYREIGARYGEAHALFLMGKAAIFLHRYGDATLRLDHALGSTAPSGSPPERPRFGGCSAMSPSRRVVMAMRSRCSSRRSSSSATTGADVARPES